MIDINIFSVLEKKIYLDPTHTLYDHENNEI